MPGMKVSPSAIATTLSKLPWRRWLIVFAAAFAFVSTWQAVGGAYSANFGTHPDEAAHVVTGMMIRDYIAGHLGEHPLAFAETFHYDHYPKVALGNWPPGFYLVQCLFTLPFGVTTPVLMMAMATITALLAIVLFETCRTVTAGKMLPAILATALWLTLPIVMEYSMMVMTELLVSLWMFLAVLVFAQYLTTGKWLWSIAFGLLASAAIMTKGTGLALALIPPLAIALTGKWHFLKRPSLWVSAVVVVVLCGPWTVLFMDQARDGWEVETYSLQWSLNAIPYYFSAFLRTAGPALVVGLVAFIPLWVQRRKGPRDGAHDGLLACCLALAVATVALHLTVPAGREYRHLIPAMAPLAVLLAYCLRVLLNVARVGNRTTVPKATLVVVLIAVVVVGLQVAAFQPKGYHGYEIVAEAAIKANGESDEPGRMLISSDSRGEGMFVSEVAMAESRPTSEIRRSSKLFATIDWSGADYQQVAETPEDVFQILKEKRIRIIVLDQGIPDDRVDPHHRLIEASVKQLPGFQSALPFSYTRDGEPQSLLLLTVHPD